MGTTIAAERIIAALRDGLAPVPEVNALWLEGSRSAGDADEYSDIDLCLNVRDGSTDAIFARVEAILAGLGELDTCYERPAPAPDLRHRVYHVAGSSEYLLLDCTVEEERRNFVFTTGMDDEPLVLFDKAGVVRSRPLDLAQLRRDNLARLATLEAEYRGYLPMVRKQFLRGMFIEAMGYYLRYVLTPLIEVLRIAHAPARTDYYIKHIYRDLPPEITAQLDELFSVAGVEECDAKLRHAERLFAQAAAHAREGQ
jgi:predicted nucleotidyltransferase